MTMRILEPGGPLVTVRCTGQGNSGVGCNALLGADREDLRFYEGGGYFDRDPAVTVRCPTCRTLTDLPKNKWPSNYRELPPYSAYWATHGKDRDRETDK